MAAELIILVSVAVAAAGFGAWAIWPRQQQGPSAQNNWQQRDGTEIESAKTDANGGTVDPVDVALGTGHD